MKTLQLLSDLHLEMHRDGGDAFIRSLDPSGVDILVLAGDISSASRLVPVLNRFCERFPHVVYVTGNHEFYGSSVDQVLRDLAAVKASNFTWLNNKLAVVDGVRFVGGTLWFPKAPPPVHANRHNINDFNLIQGFEPWVYEEHQKCVAVLQALAHTVDVVVTHHVPTTACAATRFGTALNHFFIHDMTELIEKAQPPLWLFGHTHDQWETTLGATRLAASPLGYPHEQGDPQRGHYIERRLFKVEPR